MDRYRIIVAGYLDPQRVTWLGDMTVTPCEDGSTEIVGCLPDQAALYGILSRIRDLGIRLLLVRQLKDASKEKELEV